MAQKGGFLGFDKNLIHSYVHFWHEYESSIGILTFSNFLQKAPVLEKSGSWAMVQKPLD